MTNDTMIWAADDSTSSQNVLDATAGTFGLTVTRCAPRDAARRAAEREAQVIGLEAGNDKARALALVGELHKRLPQATILLASRESDLAFVRSALEAGAGDVIALPLDTAELHKTLARAIQASARSAALAAARAPEASGEVITVCGARGGLGATTLAVNLAARLVDVADGDVALVDLDLQRGDVTAFLNLKPRNSIADFSDASGQQDDVSLTSSLIRHPNGMFVLPAPTEIEDAELIGHDETKRALDVLRARCRYTVVDTARTITGSTAAALEASRHVLVLADLSVPGVRAARRLVDLVARLGISPERVRLVIAEAARGPINLQEAVDAIGKQPYCIVPRDHAAAAEAMNLGVPLDGKPSKLATAITGLAAKIAGIDAAPKAKPAQFIRRIMSFRPQEAYA